MPACRSRRDARERPPEELRNSGYRVRHMNTNTAFAVDARLDCSQPNLRSQFIEGHVAQEHSPGLGFGLCLSHPFRRVSAARLVKRFPTLLGAIERGELHLTAVLMLGPHLTAENHSKFWLTPSTGPRKRSPNCCASSIRCPRFQLGSYPWPRAGAERSRESKLGGLRTSDEYVNLVARAKALLSHASRNVGLEELQLRAMQALVAELEKRKYAVKATPPRIPTNNPSKTHPQASSRRIRFTQHHPQRLRRCVRPDPRRRQRSRRVQNQDGDQACRCPLHQHPVQPDGTL
jgi:hypothetical protein